MSNQKKMNFQVQAFKHRDIKDPIYADKTWNILEHAIHDIFIHNASHLDFEDLYRLAYNMVLHKFGDKLYSGLVATITSHVQEMARSVEVYQGALFLEELNRKWNDYNNALQMIRDMLMYMDRTYVPSTEKTHVRELGLNLWTENVIYSNQIRSRLSNTLLELVYKERAGEEDVDIELIRYITKMLMDLGPSVYEQEFETPFLRVSAEFYKAESLKFIECCECGDYLKKAERFLNEEMDRVSHYLDSKTEKKITNVVEKETIENHMFRLIHMENSGLVIMLCDDKYEDLGRMYNLFRRVTDGLSKICEVMTSHVRESVKQITDPERLKGPTEFEERFLDVKDKYDKIMNLAFRNDELFQNALNFSFENFNIEEDGKPQIEAAIVHETT